MSSANQTKLVMTIIGPDRPGIVDALSRAVETHGGNWLESRMAQLANHFAGILLVDVPVDKVDPLCSQLSLLTEMSVQVTVVKGEGGPGASTLQRASLELTGIDQPGIVKAVTSVLVSRGVNIDGLDTTVETAPMSGEPTFTARARLQVPSEVTLGELRQALEDLGSHLMVDITLATFD